MTGLLVRLKLRLLVNQFRRSPWQVVGLVLALLYSTGITLMLVVPLLTLRLAHLPLSTAVVVGGTALTGGVGCVLHSVVGVLVVGVVASGMILLGVSSNIQQGVEGVLIIVAVALSIDRLRALYVK